MVSLLLFAVTIAINEIVLHCPLKVVLKVLRLLCLVLNLLPMVLEITLIRQPIWFLLLKQLQAMVLPLCLGGKLGTVI